MIYCNRECSEFFFPNGGYTDAGVAEFLNYGTGTITRRDLPQFLQPPAPLPRSATEGSSLLDVFSNAFGNLPNAPLRYVERPALEEELLRRLRDRNHPIITLHGRGGIGKTSTALHVAHKLVNDSSTPFDHIIWLSARDLELRPTGPTEVRRAVVDIETICKAVGKLLLVDGTSDGFARVLQDPSDVTEKGLLFIFDNFETLDDPRRVHEFLDTHTHIPNKVLITSRERAFKGDFPIEVSGMEWPEAEQLIHQESVALDIQHIVNGEAVQQIFNYTEGHPYVMRVLLGEIAKERKWVPVKSLVPKRADLLSAVFERSFNKLSPAGRWIFLTAANWRSAIPELPILVVTGLRDLDAEQGLEECVRLSLLTRQEMADGTFSYSAPELAHLFAKKKLDGDPDHLLIQEDLQTLREFGQLRQSEVATANIGDILQRFVAKTVSALRQLKVDEIARRDALIERIAEISPNAWMGLAAFRLQAGFPADGISYAYRRAVEERPFDKHAWIARASFARQQNDQSTYVHSMVSAVDADPYDIDLVREAAFVVCQYVNAHKDEIPRARRGVYLASLRANMEALADQLDATGLSRLACLFLLEGNEVEALRYGSRGYAIDPNNSYCGNLVEKLTAQGVTLE